MAFSLCMAFQTWIIIGAVFTTQQNIHKSGRLPTSAYACVPTVNLTQPIIRNQKYSPFFTLMKYSHTILNIF